MTSSPILHVTCPESLILPRLLRKARRYDIAGPTGTTGRTGRAGTARLAVSPMPPIDGPPADPSDPGDPTDPASSPGPRETFGPSPIADTLRVVTARVRSMTPEEFRASLVDAGIVGEDGKLSEGYRREADRP